MTVSARSTSPQVRDENPSLALFPIGSMEQHAAHLPVGTDLFIAREIARLVALKLDCFLLPAVPVSVSIEHMERAGTVTVSNQTLMAYVQDILESLGRQGIPQVCLLNSHGGNFVLKPFVREINYRGGFPRTILVESWAGHAASNPSGAEADKHAGYWETSIMLALDPQCVHPDLAVDFTPAAGEFDLCDYVGWPRVSPTGVWGTPSQASAERGIEYLDEAVEYLVSYIPRTFARIQDSLGSTDR